MNNAIKVGMAFAGAAAIAVGGTAFTAANTGMVDGKVGYQEVTASGVAVTSTTYNTNADNASLLDSVVYTTAVDIDTNFTAKLTLWNVSDEIIDVYTCAITGSEDPWTITCNNGSALGVSVAAVKTVGLTVTEADPAS